MSRRSWSVGLEVQPATRRYIKIMRQVLVRNNEAHAALEPYNGRALDLEIDFDSRVIGRQRMIFDWTPRKYAEDVSRARTFGFVRDAKILRQAGYALGSSLDNSITVHEDRILNPGGCATRTSSSATSCSTPSATSRSAACRSTAASARTRAATRSMRWCSTGSLPAMPITRSSRPRICRWRSMRSTTCRKALR